MKIKTLFLVLIILANLLKVNAQKGGGKVAPQKTDTTKTNLIKPVTEVKPAVVKPTQEKPSNGGLNSKPVLNQTQAISSLGSPIFSNNNDVITGHDSAQVNWSQQYVQAKGWAILDETRFPNPNQAKLMAMSGAKAVAQRNLLEMIQGVNITSEVTVKDFSTQSDAITTKVYGLLKNAEMVGEPIVKNGTVEVLMRVPLYPKGNAGNSLAGAVYDGVQNADDTLKNKLNTGRISLGRNMPTNADAPVLFPKILDGNGNEVLNYLKDFKNEGVKAPVFLKNTQENLNNLKNKNITEVIDAKLNNGNVILQSAESLKVDKWKKIGNVAMKVGKLILLFI